MDQFQTDITTSVEKKNPWWKKIAKVYALVFVLAIIFIIGVAVGSTPSYPQTSQEVLEQTSNELADIFSGNDQIKVGLFGEKPNAAKASFPTFLRRAFLVGFPNKRVFFFGKKEIFKKPKDFYSYTSMYTHATRNIKKKHFALSTIRYYFD